MSTRSLIAKRNPDNTLTFIYCHHDGFPRGGVGEVLKTYYTDPEKIDKLMSLGDLSVLGKNPVSKPENWNELPSDECLAYKDRKETDVDAKTGTEKDYYEYAKGTWAEYCYVFQDGDWYIAQFDDNPFEMKLIPYKADGTDY